MRHVQSSAAKTHFAELLDAVEQGETVVITRHGKAIARLVPDGATREFEIAEAMADIEEIRKHTGRATAAEILAWRDKGRK